MAVIKRKERQWAVRFSYTDQMGKKREYFKGGFEDEAAATAHEQDVRQGIKAAATEVKARETRAVTGTMTFGDYARSWMETTLKVATRASGYDSAAGRVTNHLIPAIGAVPLATLQKSDGEALKLALEKKGLAPKTVNHVLAVAKKVVRDAVDDGHLARNPWDRLRLVPAAAPEWDWLTPDELARFVAAVEAEYPSWLLEILLAARAGLRTCEVAGLMVEDVDLGTGEIRVKRDVVRGHVQRCKSATSHRRIVAPMDLRRELERRREVALARPARVFEVDRREHRGHLFSVNQNGVEHRYLPETIERTVTGACRAAGLRRITYYDLRHTFASHLRLAGVPLEDIRDLMGHGAIQMTLRYAHIAPARYEAAAAALERSQAEAALTTASDSRSDRGRTEVGPRSDRAP